MAHCSSAATQAKKPDPRLEDRRLCGWRPVVHILDCDSGVPAMEVQKCKQTSQGSNSHDERLATFMSCLCQHARLCQRSRGGCGLFICCCAAITDHVAPTVTAVFLRLLVASLASKDEFSQFAASLLCTQPTSSRHSCSACNNKMHHRDASSAFEM